MYVHIWLNINHEPPRITKYKFFGPGNRSKSADHFLSIYATEMPKGSLQYLALASFLFSRLPEAKHHLQYGDSSDLTNFVTVSLHSLT